jgi:hypothetical protein
LKLNDVADDENPFCTDAPDHSFGDRAGNQVRRNTDVKNVTSVLPDYGVIVGDKAQKTTILSKLAQTLGLGNSSGPHDSQNSPGPAIDGFLNAVCFVGRKKLVLQRDILVFRTEQSRQGGSLGLVPRRRLTTFGF